MATEKENIRLFLIDGGVQIVSYVVKDLKTSVTLLNPCIVHFVEEGLNIIPFLDPALTLDKEYTISKSKIIIDGATVTEDVKNAYRKSLIDFDKLIEEHERQKNATIQLN